MGAFCEFKLWLSSGPVAAVLYKIQRYIGSRYNGHRLIVFQKAFQLHVPPSRGWIKANVFLMHFKTFSTYS